MKALRIIFLNHLILWFFGKILEIWSYIWIRAPKKAWSGTMMIINLLFIHSLTIYLYVFHCISTWIYSIDKLSIFNKFILSSFVFCTILYQLIQSRTSMYSILLDFFPLILLWFQPCISHFLFVLFIHGSGNKTIYVRVLTTQ